MSIARAAIAPLPENHAGVKVHVRWFIIFAFLFAVSAQGASFTYTFFPFPANIPFGPPVTGGMNDSGQMVIDYGLGTLTPSGNFLRQPDGTASAISGQAGAQFTYLVSINNAGQMVGQSDNYGVFRDTNGTYTNLVVASTGSPAYGFGINNVGQIVGNLAFLTTAGSGFVLTAVNGSYQNLACPGNPTATYPRAINDRGQIVGSCGQISAAVGVQAGSTAFFRDTNGTFTSITQTGWIAAEARGINNAGQIVGNFVDSSGQQFGFFRDTDGTISVLQTAGRNRVTVFGINNKGQILGYVDGLQFFIATISNRTGVLAHIAAGGAWTTVITLINASSAAVPVTVAFHNDDGSALSLPVTTTNQGATLTTTTSSVTATINPNATSLITTGQLASTVVGWADVSSSGPVNGFAIFRTASSNSPVSEGTVPLQTQFPTTITVPYDNTAGFVMGVALANLSASTANVTATIWDDSGNQLGTQTITIAGSGHSSFVLPTQISLTAGKRGIVQFQSSGGIAGLGLRFSPFGTFTSVPTM